MASARDAFSTVLTHLILRRGARRTPGLLLAAALICLAVAVAVAYADTATFTAGELLGKPTATSVTVNVVPATAIAYSYQYSTTSGDYDMTHRTAQVTATGGQPSEVTINGLSADTQYYYRMIYDADGSVTDGDYETRPEHSFHTARSANAADSTFSFTVTSDIHNNLSSNEQNVMSNILGEHPDFEIDLGDTFMTDGTSDDAGARSLYVNQRGSSYFGKIGSSVPVFLATGNHEDEEGWNLDDTGSYATGLRNIAMRKAYFPLPVDEGAGGFYSGNTDPLPSAIGGDTDREDYYSWTWGDALFVVIDEFQYTANLPYAPTAGEKSDDTKTGDQWSWTLGQQQYDWLKQTLQNSDAKYKFVFSHNMLGGIPSGIISGAEAGYVRGGAEAAGYFEWGGKNADGTDGFASHRSGWDKTIQQLFEENGVSAYFHGHDHGFVYERRPAASSGQHSIVYQAMPSAGNMSLFSGIYNRTVDGTFERIATRPGNGHLCVSVEPDHATVDYILASGAIDYTVSDPAQRGLGRPDDQRGRFVVGVLKPARRTLRRAELQRLRQQPDARHPDHRADRLPDLEDERERLDDLPDARAVRRGRGVDARLRALRQGHRGHVER